MRIKQRKPKKLRWLLQQTKQDYVQVFYYVLLSWLEVNLAY